MTKTLITSAETGRILNVSPATLSKWRKEGRGPSCYRVGGVYRYDLAEVQSYLQSSRLDLETSIDGKYIGKKGSTLHYVTKKTKQQKQKNHGRSET